MLRPWTLEVDWEIKQDKPLYLQIADAIIADIQSGRLTKGMVLPGTRTLAEAVGVNRNTVVEAIQVLVDECWLVTVARKGTFVANTLPVQALPKQQQADVPTAFEQPVIRLFFDDGSPDSKIAPIEALARAYRQVFNRKGKWQMMGYSDPLGVLPFRTVIADMLNQQRGMQVNAHQLCITRGSQMAMYLVAQTLLKKGDYVLVEHPGYKAAWQAFEQAGATLLPVNVDQEGLCVEEVATYLKRYKRIKALYVTPHHQYPTTVTMSLPRRLALLELTRQYDFTLIEDDYDNEFHFGYRPVLPLSSYLEVGKYVYIGTLSKVVAPALRIGYLVTPDGDLLERISSLRKIIDVQGDTIMEQAILTLIQEGTLRRHLRKATLTYKAKRDYTARLLAQYLGAMINFTVPDGGLAFWLEPRYPVDWQGVEASLLQQGIQIILPEKYSHQREVNGLRLGYAYLSEEQLEDGISALASVLPQCRMP